MKITPITVLIYAFIATFSLYLVENFYHPVYILQMIQKIITFVLIPILVWYIWKTKIGKFGRIGKGSMKYGIWFWLLSVVIISIAYYFLRETIDWQAIQTSANARGVNETTFLLAFAYIMFGNSLVEEYFFRGVIFRNACNISQIFAYILSALMFSLYHITIFGTWFSGFVLWLALFGLFVGGLFFAWLYKKTWGIWWAWIFHIFADLTILVIGYVEIFS